MLINLACMWELHEMLRIPMSWSLPSQANLVSGKTGALALVFLVELPRGRFLKCLQAPEPSLYLCDLVGFTTVTNTLDWRCVAGRLWFFSVWRLEVGVSMLGFWWESAFRTVDVHGVTSHGRKVGRKLSGVSFVGLSMSPTRVVTHSLNNSKRFYFLISS